MKKTIGLLALAAGIAGSLAATTASADEGKFVARVRAIRIQPADKSDAFSALGINFAKDAVDVSNKTAPDIDFEYYFGGPLSAELLLTVPQKHDVKLGLPTGGALNLGSFKHLPPTLTLKYNFNPEGTFRPYVGVGLNFTMIMDVKLAVPVAPPVVLDLDRTSFGLAGQAGFDVKVADQWFLSADVKYVKIGADVKVKANGATLTTAKVDPFIFGVGVGYRF